MKPDKKVMAALAFAVLAAAINQFVVWWKVADLRGLWVVLALFAGAALLAGICFLYAFGFLA